MAIRVVGSFKLQKIFNMKMYEHGSKEIQIVRDQTLLKESEKSHKGGCIRQASKLSKIVIGRPGRGGYFEM